MKKLMVATLALCMSVVVFAKGDKDTGMGPEKKINGIITDAKCAKTKMAGNADCAKKCIEGGDKAVFVSDKGGQVWDIQNPDAVKGHEGHHVTLDAHVNAKENSVHVESVSMLPDQPKSESSGSMHK